MFLMVIKVQVDRFNQLLTQYNWNTKRNLLNTNKIFIKPVIVREDLLLISLQLLRDIKVVMCHDSVVTSTIYMAQIHCMVS